MYNNINKLLSLFYLIYAIHKRNKGKYDLNTQKYFKKAYEKNSLNIFYFLRFQRDLGILLTESQFNKISFNRLTKKQTIFLISYAIESGIIKTNNIHENNEIKKILFLHKKINNNYIRFNNYLNKNKQFGICVVGNANNIYNNDNSSLIDKNKTILRFNNFKLGKFFGEKTTIICINPSIIYNYTYNIKTKWIIISGPNSILQVNNFLLLHPELLDKIITIPLNIWNNLICYLHQPPSAGIIIFMLLKNILGSLEYVTAAGFLFTKNNHINKKNITSSRHNWNKEKKIFNELSKEMKCVL